MLKPRFLYDRAMTIISRRSNKMLTNFPNKISQKWFHLNNYKEKSLLKQLQAKIKFSGPLTIYEFMKEVLTNPLEGYYMQKNVLGSKGDFITSPEISQLFGELIGIWIYYEWRKMGALKPFQLVELGPGTGALMQDIIRSLKQLKLEKESFQIHLVEKSLQMSKLQEEKLCGNIITDSVQVPENLDSHYKTGLTKDGHKIFWHYHLQYVPKQFSFFIAHEFFDALPIHKLKITKNGWREILVDASDESEGLKFVLANGPTPASLMYIDPNERRNEVEVSPDSGVIIEELSVKIKEDGGAALIIDYGHEGTLTDTFRAFKDQKQVSPLSYPGNCDLTADVDFKYLKRHISDAILAFGPISQQVFLRNMGIEFRLQKLLENCDDITRNSLKNSYQMLVDPQQMGDRFKVMTLLPKTMSEILHSYPVAGFFK